MSPELAAALVAAQSTVKTIVKGEWNDQTKYSYVAADAVCAEARRVLCAHGLAWVRTSATLSTGALASANIGKQSYVGEVTITGLIIHTSGASIEVTETIPIIASGARPHDKATAASITYGTGYLLLGVLCADRDDKQAIDARNDSELPDEPTCETAAPDLVKINKALCDELADLAKRDRMEVWRKACEKAGVPMDGGDYPGPRNLYVDEGKRVAALLDKWVTQKKYELGIPTESEGPDA